MDGRRFDGLTATLASATDRRKAVTSLLAGFTAALFGTRDEAEGRRRCDRCRKRCCCICNGGPGCAIVRFFADERDDEILTVCAAACAPGSFHDLICSRRPTSTVACSVSGECTSVLCPV